MLDQLGHVGSDHAWRDAHRGPMRAEPIAPSYFLRAENFFVAVIPHNMGFAEENGARSVTTRDLERGIGDPENISAR